VVGGNRTVIDDTGVRSRVEMRLDDGNGHGESASYRPAGDHGADKSDERRLPYRTRLGGLLVVSGIWMGPRKNLGKEREAQDAERELNIVRCEQ
jgi:hypothetical protein